MGFSHHHLPSEQFPLFLLAQPALGEPGVTARMELGPATQTFVLELRCLEDGGPGPDTLSGEGWGVETMGPLHKDSLVEFARWHSPDHHRGTPCVTSILMPANPSYLKTCFRTCCGGCQARSCWREILRDLVASSLRPASGLALPCFSQVPPQTPTISHLGLESFSSVSNASDTG